MSLEVPVDNPFDTHVIDGVRTHIVARCRRCLGPRYATHTELHHTEVCTALRALEERLDEHIAWHESDDDDDRGDFCGKAVTDVKQLIGGAAGGQICDECIRVCGGMLEAKP